MYSDEICGKCKYHVRDDIIEKDWMQDGVVFTKNASCKPGRYCDRINTVL